MKLYSGFVLTALFLSAVAEAQQNGAPGLNHRLKPGEHLQFTVDAQKRLQNVPRGVTGIAIGSITGYAQPYFPYEKNPEGTYVLPQETEDAARELNLSMTRFYGLSLMPFGLNGTIDRCAELCNKFGIPQESTPIELEGAKKFLSVEEWISTVKYSLSKGYKFKMWEITNEPWDHFKAEDYANHVIEISKAIKSIQPDAQIGMALKRANDLEFKHEMLLEKAAGHYDWISAHYYDFSDAYATPFEGIVLAGNFRSLDCILHNAELIKKYNPAKPVYQYDTEWGLHSIAPKGKKTDDLSRNANIHGALYRAVRLIYYVRENFVRGAGAWSLFSYPNRPGFAHLGKDPGKIAMPYWVHYYFNRHLGELALDLDGTAPYYSGSPGEPYKSKKKQTFSGPLTPLVVTMSKDGNSLFLIVANGSWNREIPLSMDMKNFTAAKSAGVALSSSNPDAHPFLEKKEDFVSDLPIGLEQNTLTCTLPPHSVVFVTMTGVAGK
ncbi:MAG TPA: hypothetical protein DCZ94_18840 [Lentisphaeria bacterium]|nr:MAG: hypothetical protein A2X48_22055 [Lentisphaerae bacterium GWF2_49_21]HBC89001.1 hypothetical protein [Lentisphaeria bacterium]